MNDILTNVSSPAVAAAVEANLFEYLEYLGRSASVEFHRSPHLTWFVTGIQHPFMNGVLQTRLAPGDVDDAVEDVLEQFKGRKLPCMWWVGQDTEPTGLGQHLVAHGLTYSEDSPGMAADLQPLNEGFSTLRGLEVLPVGDDEDLGKWVEAAIAGFELPHSSGQACFDLFAGLGYDLPVRSYVGLLNGKPVAASQLFLAAGVVGIYWVATAPEARRHGIGTALSLAPLAHAREIGYRIGILHPSEAGLGVYRRLGFEQRCTLRRGVWIDKSL